MPRTALYDSYRIRPGNPYRGGGGLKLRAGGLKSLGRVLKERPHNLRNRPELANDLG